MEESIFVNRVVINPPMGKHDVLLRPGLNVIRAVLFDKSLLVEEQEGSRNSVGKTSFVNLIDFGLGKDRFLGEGKEKGRRELRDRELIMEIAIGNENLTVIRNLVKGELSHVYSGWITEQLLAGGQPDGKLLEVEDYRQLLENLLYDGENIVNGKKFISFRKMIGFLIREQLGGFESTIKVGSYYDKKSEQIKAIEFLSGLTTQNKILLDQEKAKADKEVKEAKKQYDVIKNYVKDKVGFTKGGINKNLKRIDKEIISINKGIKLIDLNMVNLQKVNEQQNINKRNLLERRAAVGREISIYTSRINSYEATLNETFSETETLELSKKAKNIFGPIGYRNCPVCLVPINAQDSEFSCPREQETQDDSIEIIKKILENERSDLQKAIRSLKSTVEYLNHELVEINDIILDIDNSFESEMENLIHLRNQESTKLSDFEKERFYWERLIGFLEDMENYKNTHNNKKDALLQVIERWKQSNDLIQEHRELLRKTFDEIVRYLYNNSRRGNIEFENNGDINAEVRFVNDDGVDDGAAASTLTVIAFDLALLKLSVYHETYHPRFLVHDSPNVRDIDPIVYSRIFMFVRNLELEVSLRPELKSFQYIITTIELPQEIENYPKYIRLELNNNGDEGKLFGITF